MEDIQAALKEWWRFAPSSPAGCPCRFRWPPVPQTTMLIRLHDPDRQVDLLVFLRNSGIFALEKEDGDTIRVFDVETERLAEVIAAWESMDAANRADLEP